jgi:DNA replication protein DnaC
MLKPSHLQHKLRTLRLGGMLDTLDLRLDQAQQGPLGYLEFLELLLEDEIGRRAAKSLTSRVVKAHFEEQKTLEEFDWSFNPTIPTARIRDLASGQFIARKESILLCGPVGVGKTFLAQALGHQACRIGYSVLFTKTARLLADLGGGRADGTWAIRLRRYLHPEVLILDDFGLREFSLSQAEDIYELVCERCRAGSMIVTSNRSPQDWYGLFPNPVLAESTLDRLINRAHHLTLVGKSYRPLQRPDRAIALAEEATRN